MRASSPLSGVPERGSPGGLNARALRLRRKLTLDEVAAAADLSKGHLSRFERGDKSLSVAALIRLAGALGTSMSSLLGETFEGDAVHVLRLAERRTIRAPAEEGSYAFSLLNRSDERGEIDVLTVELSAEVSITGGVTHAGQESFLVLDGDVEVEIGDRTYRLSKGDFLDFAGNLRHRVTSVSPTSSVLVVVAKR